MYQLVLIPHSCALIIHSTLTLGCKEIKKKLLGWWQRIGIELLCSWKGLSRSIKIYRRWCSTPKKLANCLWHSTIVYAPSCCSCSHPIAFIVKNPLHIFVDVPSSLPVDVAESYLPALNIKRMPIHRNETLEFQSHHHVVNDPPCLRESNVLFRHRTRCIYSRWSTLTSITHVMINKSPIRWICRYISL